jgi:inorganic pyrophosphatase
MEDLDDLPGQLRAEITHFFTVYKDLDADRHSEVRGWGTRDEALRTIDEARRRFQQTAR